MARPQLSKETIKEAMKGAKRVDKIIPNMILNQTILDHYHNVRPDNQDQESPLIVLHQELLGGGAWTRKAKRKMREKYFIAREQYVRMEPPTLKAGFSTCFSSINDDLLLRGPSSTQQLEGSTSEAPAKSSLGYTR